MELLGKKASGGVLEEIPKGRGLWLPGGGEITGRHETFGESEGRCYRRTCAGGVLEPEQCRI